MWNLHHDTNELCYKAETDFQPQRTDLRFPGRVAVREGGMLPEFWLPVHWCQMETWRRSLEEIKKNSFIIFARQKGNRPGWSLRKCAPSLGDRESVYILMKVLLFFFLLQSFKQPQLASGNSATAPGVAEVSGPWPSFWNAGCHRGA